LDSLEGNHIPLETVIDCIRNAGFSPPDPEDIERFAHIKRFRERWRADPQFRASFRYDPGGTAAAWGLKAAPEEVRPFWDERHRDGRSPVIERYLAFHRQWTQRVRERLRAVPTDSRLAAWRQRQIYRLNLEVGAWSFHPHITASFELSRGCSVGCWFCSSSPPKLSDVFRYTAENARLWREILESARAVSGPTLAKLSICYSGTDPFDNPDYERFLDDFKAINGDSPITSTALAVRDPERTRSLIGICGPNQLRFSVLSVGMLNRIHKAFTAEEMLLVLVSLRNEGAVDSHLMRFAGRAREREKTYRKHRPGEPLIHTPACVSGFRFNLVDRVIQLVSPCGPDDRWPMGERVYDEAQFDDANDVRRILEEMMARHMPVEPDEERTLRFHRHLQYEQDAGGFKLTTVHLRQRFEETPEAPFMGRLGALVESGGHTPAQIGDILAAERGVPRESVRLALNDLFRLGLLDDEPAVSPASISHSPAKTVNRHLARAEEFSTGGMGHF
jgi:radical SAM family RiPP maturation amino acid epimerase